MFAGFCGGFIGINAPPLVTHFGSILSKSHLRKLLVFIFIPAAFAQTATFAFTGLLTIEIIRLGLLMIPGMIVGIYIGNRAHLTFSERKFKIILGLFLVIVSLKIILS